MAETVTRSKTCTCEPNSYTVGEDTTPFRSQDPKVSDAFRFGKKQGGSFFRGNSVHDITDLGRNKEYNNE